MNLFGFLARRPRFEPSPLQTESFAQGRARGNDPSTPYGLKTPEGLGPVAFAAGLIEGRAEVMNPGHRALRGRLR